MLATSGQSFDRHEEAAEALVLAGRRERALCQSLKFTAQHGERRAQFVRCVSHKALRLLKRLIKPRDHAIQRNRQPLKLIARVGNRQTLGKIMMGDELGLAGDLLHGRKRALYQHIAAAYGDDQQHRQAQRREPQQLTQ